MQVRRFIRKIPYCPEEKVNESLASAFERKGRFARMRVEGTWL